MHLQAGQTVYLSDADQHRLGRVVIDKIEDSLVLGTFTAEPDYGTVEPLFSEFVDAAQQQLVHRIDELDTLITALGLRLDSTNGIPLPAIEDVQIADRNISLRIRVPDRIERSSLPTTSSLQEN